ncbi:MAG: N-acetylmuramidase domain-containing protein [Candidatus Solibacter sp.]
MTNFLGASLPISSSGMAKATQLLGVSPAEVWTVLSVETHGFGYLNDRRPAILFERHIFRKQTGGRFDAVNPSISSPAAGGYLGGAKEYDRLAQAVVLDPHAALLSASWGIGQVMGFNFAAAGFASVEAMVAAMVQSEDSQLEGMAAFVRTQGLNKPLASHDWAGFAKGYNGPDFAKNAYDARLSSSFQKFAAGPLPDIRVRQAQALLGFLGFDAGGVDGVIGKRTRSAVAMFRGTESDTIDDTLITALMAKLTSAAASA